MDWLTFSLSNQPSFLEAFNPTLQHGGVSEQAEDDSRGEGSDLTILTAVGPKLEDFLGGSGEPLRRFSASSPSSENDGTGIYDSDLKTIAAGFLRGFPSDPQDSDNIKAVVQPEPKKTVDTFGQRTSIYRGVTRHRWTGRYEAHLWDNSCRREGQSRKGRQVYLGGYDKEDRAARAYDLAALKYWGPTTTTNFPVSNYEKELEEMKNMTRQEFVASLRRKSSGFSRGASIYRGVTRHHQHGRWQARIGRVAGNKDLYLGTFSTQEEAAEAYDIAAIKFRGLNAVTNFDMSRYDVKSIANSNLPIGGMSNKVSKASECSSSSSESKGVVIKHMDGRDLDLVAASSSYGFALPIKQDQYQDYWSLLALHQQNLQHSQGNPSFNAFSSGVNMDFSAPSAHVVGQANGNFMWNNGGFIQQENEQEQSQGSTCSIPYATPIAMGSGFENSSYGGSWVTPAYHQVAKPNIGVYQTPIFGME